MKMFSSSPRRMPLQPERWGPTGRRQPLTACAPSFLMLTPPACPSLGQPKPRGTQLACGMREAAHHTPTSPTPGPTCPERRRAWR